MARDYAKRRTTKQDPKKSSGNGGWRIIALLVAGVLIFGAWYGYKQKQLKSNTLPPVVEAQSVTSAPVVDADGQSKKADGKEINFEFYSALPKMEVADSAPTQVSTVDANKGYWIQLGAFFTEDTAGDMQERMQLLGLDPVISHYESKKTGRTIYRVEIGPYQTYQDAQSKQQELEQMKVSSMIRKAG